MTYNKKPLHHGIPNLACFGAAACSQNTITGTFPDLANQQVKLVGFEGFDTYVIDSVSANSVRPGCVG